MRVLVLSNLYPPYYIGGYEIRCHHVVEQLRQRGHSICVATSQYGLNNHSRSGGATEEYVWRVLSFRWFQNITQEEMYRLEMSDHRHFRRLIHAIVPEVIYIWNCSGLTKSLLVHVQSYSIPVVYQFDDDWFLQEFVKDPWLTYSSGVHPVHLLWQAHRIRHAQRLSDEQHPFLAHIPKTFVYRIAGKWMSRRLPLGFGQIDFRYACFVSQFRKNQYLQAGWPVQNARVIGGGIDTTSFVPCSEKADKRQIKILCVAQLYEGKGIHTVIDAAAILLQQENVNLTLTIVGSEVDETRYAEFLQQKIQASQRLKDAVHFTGKVSHDKMAVIYQEHDLFISSSIIPEGLPLTILEAMASGLIVFATGTGGGQEIIRHAENGFLFPPGDCHALARQVERVLSDRIEWQHIITQAVQTAKKFDIQRVAEKIEVFLNIARNHESCE